MNNLNSSSQQTAVLMNQRKKLKHVIDPEKLNQSYERNLNNFQHLELNGGCRQTVGFIKSLRRQSTPLSTKEKGNRINFPPSCHNKTLESQQFKHSNADVEIEFKNFAQVEHLLWKRLGPTPLVGQILFETSLRSKIIQRKPLPTLDKQGSTEMSVTTKRTEENFKKIKRIVQKDAKEKTNQSFTNSQQTTAKEKQLNQSYQLSIGYSPYRDLKEKNASLYKNLLKDEKGGDVRQDVLQWQLQLKKYDDINTQHTKPYQSNGSFDQSSKQSQNTGQSQQIKNKGKFKMK